MESKDEICTLLGEIRDLLLSREQKYDDYLKQSRATYSEHARLSRRNSWLSLIWFLVAAFLGTYAAMNFYPK